MLDNKCSTNSKNTDRDIRVQAEDQKIKTVKLKVLPLPRLDNYSQRPEPLFLAVFYFPLVPGSKECDSLVLE